MKLEVYDEDLAPEHKGCNTSLTTFDKFNEVTKLAIKVVGRATFYNADRSSYNAIYPPKMK